MTKTPSRLINRELSWLEFNQRVLDEAQSDSFPLLERLKFLAISASNLDEFFMVRVGGLQMLVKLGRTNKDPSGLTPTQHLQAISKRTHAMMAAQADCYLKLLEPALVEAGLNRIAIGNLSYRQMESTRQIFESTVYPVLSPMAVSCPADFPLLVNQSLNVIVQLAPADAESTEPRFAVIPLGSGVSRFITLASDGGYEYVLLEELVAFYVSRFFPGETVIESIPFRLSRNADLHVREDSAADLLSEMEQVLDARKQSNCVRLEISAGASDQSQQFLRAALGIDECDIYALPCPLDLASLMPLTDIKGFDEHRNQNWPPIASSIVDSSASMFENLAQRDILLCHPFESFEPVVRLIEEAADDPDVMAIKQILYRTSRNSPVVAALNRAAQNGKQVTVVLELKARFDEARNIEWAKNLEQSGVQVIYGVKGYKTHAKICIVVRREPHGIQRYLHFGTGNYNEVTAKLYTDISYLTCNEELGADATRFFNAITGYSQPQKFLQIEAAPIGLRDKLLELIESETERKRHGQRALIMAKLNSLVDPELIEALYTASQAGVKVELNVRGICCLRPGVPGMSENITVVSIIDRFLEHSRILYFHHGNDPKVFISSADWMPRNLDRRIELLVPVSDPSSLRRLIHILKTCLSDNLKGRQLLADGSYVTLQPAKKKVPMRSQEALYLEVKDTLKQTKQATPVAFVPERAQKTSPETLGVTQSVAKQSATKTLLLLRHAKSSWHDEQLADHDRPLNDRGKKNAPGVGKLLKDRSLVPNLIVSSTALRADQTTRLVAEACGYRGEIRMSGDLYLATPAECIGVLSLLPDELDRIMLVGHNPGLEELLYALTDCQISLPTATLAQVELKIGNWRKLELATDAKLIDVWTIR